MSSDGQVQMGDSQGEDVSVCGVGLVAPVLAPRGQRGEQTVE